MVTVRAVGDADYDLVAAILERHDPIDVDDHLARADLPVTTVAEIYGEAPSMPVLVTTAPGADMTSLSLSEESLTVSKRLVNRGNTCIRRYVVEKAVEQDVTLRDEMVTIERRPVSGGSAGSDTAFTDKVIEMTAIGGRGGC